MGVAEMTGGHPTAAAGAAAAVATVEAGLRPGVGHRHQGAEAATEGGHRGREGPLPDVTAVEAAVAAGTGTVVGAAVGVAVGAAAVEGGEDGVAVGVTPGAVAIATAPHAAARGVHLQRRKLRMMMRRASRGLEAIPGAETWINEVSTLQLPPHHVCHIIGQPLARAQPSASRQHRARQKGR